MLHRIVDLEFSRAKGRIDDEPLQRLLHGHEVVHLRDRLYFHQGVPHLLVSVTYRLAALPAPRSSPAGNGSAAQNTRDARHGGSRDEWRRLLHEENAPLFEKLRAWRSARARAEAVPAYVILTNAQLAVIVNARPATLAALGRIDGIGSSRLKRYGADILKVLAEGTVAMPDERELREPSGGNATISAAPKDGEDSGDAK